MTHEDPIIDPLLEELLADQQMPDLTAQILQRHNQRQQQTAARQNGHAKAPLTLSAASSATQVGPHHAPQVTLSAQYDIQRRLTGKAEVARRRLRRQRTMTALASLALSLGLLVVLGGVAYYQYQQFVPGQGMPLVADGEQSPSDGVRGTADDSAPDQAPLAAADESQLAQGSAEKEEEPFELASSEIPPPQAVSQRPAMPRAEPIPVDQMVLGAQKPESPRHVTPRVRPSLALSDQQVVEQIDQHITQVWQAAGVSPSPDATDHEFCRRTYLQLLGRIPTVEELQRFVSRRGRDKRRHLVDEILNSDQYSAELASFWSARMANLLVGQAGGMSADSPVDRQALETYLATAIQKNTPYHQLVEELLTATGTTSPGSENYNPATNFLVATLDADAKLATARTCATFLGQQLQCAECHTHPTTGWSQQKFWALNAFFRQAKLAKDRETGQLAVVDQDFVQPGQSDSGEVYYEQPNGLIKVAFPEFIDGTTIPASGKLAEVDRRKELAQLIINSDQFPRATVNRMWRHFFGVGFTQPVDDMGPHNPASHPELLDQLAENFAQSGFDLKRLMRWITLSEAYGLSSRQTDANLADNPDAGAPLFARYYSRQMEAEQLFHSLQLLAKSRPAASGLIASAKDRHTWLGQVAQKMGDDEDSETTALDGGITQTLLMMNGGLMRQATDTQAAVLKSVVRSKMSPREKVEHLFLAALSRRPTKKELATIDEILRHRQDEPAALQDIWWALLNSNEFILDH